jgi:2-dehydro-3-deoxyphosphogluconate aldolase/(4S)-4-hydroxy-2-oxoglutarate aldolase
MNIAQILALSPVMPVIVVRRIDDAVPLARALVDGGIRVLEVTLRTPVALDAIHRICRECPDAVVGAGTVTRPEELAAAARAGAAFAVSPGITPRLVEGSRVIPIPLLPGVMTPSEAMAARDAGFEHLKLFPAQQAGGIGMLKAMAGPLADLRFCPTGGITADNAAEFLRLPNVVCVGGSWLAPEALVERGDWAAVEELARAASALSVRHAGFAHE